MRGTVVVALLLVAIAARPAAAHQTSVKYVDIAVEDARATVRLTVAPGDVTEPLGLPADAQPTLAHALAQGPHIAAYVQRWLAIAPDDADGSSGPCVPDAPRAAADADARFVVVEWHVACAQSLHRLALDFRAFFAVDARHEAIATVHARDAQGDAAVVRAASPILRVQVGEALGVTGWIAAGMEHIWSGRDHVCFVLALLLVVMLVRDPDNVWATRAPRATVRHTAAIVTAFTVAHSLSLIAASLGWLRLPSAFVEAAIAFSILYTAIEDIARPAVRYRFALTFAFGLVHGLGFASVLEELLPPDHVIGPLLGFNLGVELGQLVIVTIALPIFWLLSRELGADRYRRRVLPIFAIAIAVLAAKWLIERVLSISLGSFWGM